jgi:hypothetical protein
MLQYLKQEDKENFMISEKAGALYELFLKELKEKGKDLEFMTQIQAMYQYPSACYYIAESALQAFDPQAEKNIVRKRPGLSSLRNLIRKISNGSLMK